MPHAVETGQRAYNIYIEPLPNYFIGLIMKGISAIIATILMLLITVALAGTAYLFISGTFSRFTSAVLSIDGQLTTCQSQGPINVYVKNDGSSTVSNVVVDITYPNGVTNSSACTIFSIYAGSSNSTVCPRNVTTPSVYPTSGSFAIRVAGGGSAATGNVYCNS